MNKLNPILNLPTAQVSREEAMEAVKTLIRFLGDNPEREGLLETPARVIKAYEEIFKGYGQDPAEILQKTFTSGSKEMVVLSNIELYSTCEHHMLPFVGKCHIAYLPTGKVIGISKLARLMEVFSRRLQIQEDLTCQIANALDQELSPLGVAVMIEAQHMCMTSRGVGKQNSYLTTTSMLGAFDQNEQIRRDFFRVIDRGHRQL